MNNENILGAINMVDRANQTSPTLQPNTDNANLQKACREFEGMLLNIILKQALNSDTLNENSATGNDIMREFSIEQTARQLGHTDAFGLGKLLFEQITHGRNDSSPANRDGMTPALH